ncbi:DUF4177 domain-containing protein [Loktanella sp. Alg231-35]|uniref:DUF4177 domain-containing protein n=1 Tax=Loktanella sp. Alg231-35 TaxID=1922220 RepID=UPI000D55A9E9|nr:DUF4177 domain-containing protein [Loktanella sp. Alg231-35]
MSYEYKVIPAPARGLKAKGVKTSEDRFANALETAINTLAAKGWEYVRADTLPCEQREGLMGKTTVYQNMLVFRRAKAAKEAAPVIAAPTVSAAPAKTGEERIAEKKALANPKPVTAPKPEKWNQL